MDAQRNLLRVMNLPARFVGVVRTSDGHYLAQEEGDLGYNAFLGRPAPIHDGPGLTNTLRIWAGLTEEEQEAVRAAAAYPVDGVPIPLADFGIPDTVFYCEKCPLPSEGFMDGGEEYTEDELRHFHESEGH